MATNTMNISSINKAITEIQKAIATISKNESFALGVLDLYTFVAGLVCPYSATALTALAAAYSSKVDKVLSNLRSFLKELVKYRDFLNTHPKYDLIRVRIDFESWTGSDGKSYKIPIKSTVIALHSGSGWVLL